jgi:hypothetical protein
MWFAANLLFRSTHIPTEAKPTIWEESVRLIQALTEAEALKEAERIGRSGSHTYEVEHGLVIWTFEKVERVYAIEDEELRSGSEVFSRFLRDSEVQSLLQPFDDQS